MEEPAMEMLPLTEVRKKLSYLVAKLSAKGEEIVITKNSRPVVMLMGLDEVESKKETLLASFA